MIGAVTVWVCLLMPIGISGCVLIAFWNPLALNSSSDTYSKWTLVSAPFGFDLAVKDGAVGVDDRHRFPVDGRDPRRRREHLVAAVARAPPFVATTRKW